MKSDFLIALTQLAAERNLPREIVLSAIEAALASAYKKDSMTAGQSISVKLDPATGEVMAYIMKTVVESLTDPRKEISLADARKIKKDAQLDDSISVETLSHSAGRIAAQTAKQVVMQRLREAERELVYEEYAEKEGDVVAATVQRLEPKLVVVDLGRTEAIIPAAEQVPAERYRGGQKMKVLLLEVRRTNKGPEILVSRTHKTLLKRLFELEVPEVSNGVVEIMAIAREPGSRSKVAVWARQDGIDAVGSCVGLRGIRIQNIVNELQGEKIDVVQWHKDPAILLANALSPSQVIRVEVDQDDSSATVVVPDRQLSLAIGKEGQNARLASRLTGLKVDIKSASEAEAERTQHRAGTQAAARAQVVEAPAEAPPEAKAPALEEVEAAVQVPVEAAAEPQVSEDLQTLQEEVDAEIAPPAEEVEETPAPDGALSAEEELAAISLQETEKAEQAPEVESGTSLEEVPDSIWAIPHVTAPEPGRLRFAEDIMAPRAPRDRGGRGRRKGREAEAGAKARKGGGRRVKVPGGNGGEEGDST